MNKYSIKAKMKDILKNWYRLLLPILFFSFSSVADAQDPVRKQDSMNLSLQKAVELSLQNSKKLKVSQARIDQATASLKQAIDSRLPDFKVGGSYLLLNDPNVDMKIKSSGNGNGSEPKASQAMYGMATASVPVYSGLRIRYGIESARYLEQASRLDGENDKEEIIVNTIHAFTNLYKSKVAVEIVRENLNQSIQRDADFSNHEKNGLMARNDLLKAQLQTSNIELALVNAENNLKLASVSLNLMMGLPERTGLIPDSASLELSPDLKSIEEYEQLAFNNRKDAAALSLKLKAAGTSVKASKADYYPTVALSAGFLALDVPKVLTVTNAFNAGVGIQYNLGSLWKTRAKTDQAKAVEREVSANQEILADQIRLEINQAYEDFLSARKKIEVETKAVENGKENYRITKNKYDNSLVTTTDLLDANVALLQSQINLQAAKADIVAAYNTLLQKSGLLNNSLPVKQ
jgi:outer membrane protein